MNNYGSEEDKLKNENSPNKLSLNRSLTNISLDEQLIGKRMKNNTKNNLKSNQTDKNIERKIFDTNKKDVELKKFQIDKCLKDIETTVIEKEKRRNVMLQNEFDKERNYLIDQQKSVKTQIEDVSRNNMNEKIIKMLKEGINSQQELFNKYFLFNNEIISQINKFKDYLPQTKNKIEEKKKSLKKFHLENITLLEKLDQLEKHAEKNVKVANSNSDSFIEDKPKILLDGFESSPIKNNSHRLNKSDNNDPPIKLSRLKYNEYGSENPINISSLLNENDLLKEKYDRSIMLRQRLRIIKDELNRVMIGSAKINTENIHLSKLYSAGIHEVSQELLNVHESQLDRIKESGNKALYNQLLKQRANYTNSIALNFHKNDIKLPIINHNIMHKYRYPIIEKEDTHSLIYNVIKNLLNEHNNLSKNSYGKKKKFDWDEFSSFTAYQIFTLISLTPEIFKKIERKLFPITTKDHKSNTLFLTDNTII